MLAELFLHCPACAKARPVETPPCPDGHGPDCPDRACAACGTALFIDPQTTRASYRPAATRHAA